MLHPGRLPGCQPRHGACRENPDHSGPSRQRDEAVRDMQLAVAGVSAAEGVPPSHVGCFWWGGLRSVLVQLDVEVVGPR